MKPQLPPKKFNPFPYAYHQELEVEVSSLSNLGDGIAKVPVTDQEGQSRDWVIFIPFALPEDTVRIKVWKNESNCSHADLLEIVTPSPERIEPKCKYFGQCGGCQYQHLSYESQLKWKTQHVAELLNRLAGVDHPVNAPLPSPTEWHYRSKITPHFQKPRGGKIGDIGFLKKGSRQSLLDIDYCPIAMQAINDILPAARDAARNRAKTYKKGATLLFRANEERVYDNPRDIMSEQVGDLTFHFLAGDFFQNNPFILPAFVDYACQQAMSGSTYLIDAYCGSGLFGLSLAKHFQEVSMVEVSETGADWARYNARENKIDNAKILTASAEHIFQDITYPSADTTVLIDPPRKGCNEEFLQQLFAFGPQRVVYISCNPATQARDLKFFDDAGYQIQDVQPVDLFPQTRHLECIVTLVRSHD